jgi:hypothetical protein
MKAASDFELIVAMSVVCISLVVGLYVSVYSLRHSLNIVKTKQYRRPTTGQLITGQKAVWIGVMRTLVSGFALITVLGLVLYLLFRLSIAALG